MADRLKQVVSHITGTEMSAGECHHIAWRPYYPAGAGRGPALCSWPDLFVQNSGRMSPSLPRIGAWMQLLPRCIDTDSDVASSN